ncbi:MAG: two-component regulator propeller domain-containing protein [Vicinamibacterales bacterium]
MPITQVSRRAFRYPAFARVVLVASLLLAFATSALAVDLRDVLTGYTFTSWSRKDGLVGPVFALAQDPNGFLWLGTDSGLVRFDGVRFSSWEALGGQPLPRLPIRALHITQLGTLWVGFGGTGGLARIDNRVVTPLVTPGSPDFAGPVNALSEGAGSLWVSATTGLLRLTNEKWERVGAGDGISTDGPVTGYVDGTGALWVSASNGLFRRPSADAGAFQLIEPTTDPLRTLAFSEDQNGRVWAADIGVGFRALGPGPDVRGRDAARGYRLLHDRVGHLWVATIGQGLWRVDQPDATKGAVSVQRATVLTGLSSDAVRTVFEDRDGNIWAGTTEGVDRLVPHRVTPFADIGLVTTIDSTTDGRVWAGTADALVSFAVNGNEWRATDRRIALRGITAVRGSTADGLWATTPSTLFRVRGDTATPYTPPANGKRITLDALTTDGAGDAWVVTSAGEVLKTERGELHAVAQLTELNGARANAALLDSTGRLWVIYAGTKVGMLDTGGQFHAFPEASVGAGTHYDLFEDAAGTIWTSGADSLARFADGHFQSIGIASGLPSGGIYSITQDERRDLWMATAAGIVRMDPAEFDRAITSRGYIVRLRIYDTSDGLAGYPVALGDRNAVRAHDGTLWFVTSRGITMANPRRLNTRRPATLVGIDAVRADDEPVTANELRPGTTKLEIDYTAPELTSPLKTRFRYRLEGFDNDWVDAGTRRSALYTGLPPGDYTFHVSVSQDDGRWSETEATWSFSERPRFRQTWWFVALVALGMTGVLFLAWRIRVRQLRQPVCARAAGTRAAQSRTARHTAPESRRRCARVRCGVQIARRLTERRSRARDQDSRAGRGVHPRGSPLNLESAFAGARDRQSRRRPARQRHARHRRPERHLRVRAIGYTAPALLECRASTAAYRSGGGTERRAPLRLAVSQHASALR